MSEYLFADFLPATKDRWKQQALRELRGKDFMETLLWHTPEGLTLEPYYTAEDLETLPLAAIQAAQKQAPGWENRVEFLVEHESTANQLAREALTQGADALTFDLRATDPKTLRLPRLLDGIKLSDSPVTFRFAGSARLLTNHLRTFIGYQWRGSLHDTQTANWDEWAELFIQTDDSPGFRVATIHNATPQPVESLTEVLTYLTELLHQLTERGLTAAHVLSRLEFSLTAGTDYYTELAKIRALRFLVAHVAQAYEVAPTPIFVHATTLHAVPHADATEFTDLIRATAEAMSVLVGGCDALTVSSLHHPDAFSHRLARNVSNLLRHESYFAQVADPAAGSYFLETLTWALVQKAWEKFLAHKQP
ncbi:MAG: methylmalonyl-CoA mutase family protein [Cytophagaceae bacterium]|nr:methylmalonyl-CoA mutase family protein [Cytophagaceae bacterium]